jgi:hypothetical protein
MTNRELVHLLPEEGLFLWASRKLDEGYRPLGAPWGEGSPATGRSVAWERSESIPRA